MSEAKEIKNCVFFLCAFPPPPSEVAVPSVIILNTSNEQYFLPSEPIETVEQLVQFINSVLNGSAQVQVSSSSPSPALCLFVPLPLALHRRNHTTAFH